MARVTSVSILPAIDGTTLEVESYDISFPLETDETKPTNSTVPKSHALGKRCKIKFTAKPGAFDTPKAGAAVDLSVSLASGVTLAGDIADLVAGVYTDFGVMEDVDFSGKQNDLEVSFTVISDCGTFLS